MDHETAHPIVEGAVIPQAEQQKSRQAIAEALSQFPTEEHPNGKITSVTAIIPGPESHPFDETTRAQIAHEAALAQQQDQSPSHPIMGVLKSVKDAVAYHVPTIAEPEGGHTYSTPASKLARIKLNKESGHSFSDD